MNNLMQPLKLQIASSYKAYIFNLLVITIGCALAYFVGNNSIDSYSYILGFEYLFTLAMGIYNSSIIGKTYYDLKHDRRLFTLSSIIINLVNAIFMLLLYFTIIILTKNIVLPINLFNYILSFILAYTLANTYALFTNNVKFINLIFIIIISLFCLLFGHIARIIITYITSTYFFPVLYQELMYIIKPEIAFIINLSLILILNIINSLKYNKAI